MEPSEAAIAIGSNANEVNGRWEIDRKSGRDAARDYLSEKFGSQLGIRSRYESRNSWQIELSYKERQTKMYRRKEKVVVTTNFLGTAIAAKLALGRMFKRSTKVLDQKTRWCVWVM